MNSYELTETYEDGSKTTTQFDNWEDCLAYINKIWDNEFVNSFFVEFIFCKS